MPFYEYECSSCGSHHEVLQGIGDAPLKKCPKCGKSALRKLISAPVFRLKGSGWYETDFKSDQEQKRNLVGSEKEETKSEAKPDANDAKGEAVKADAAKGDAGASAAKSVEKSAGKPASARPVKRAPRKPAAKKKARR